MLQKVLLVYIKTEVLWSIDKAGLVNKRNYFSLRNA